MTIKAVKEKYRNYECGAGGHNSFVVYDYNDGYGKYVIVVNVSRRKYVGDYVTAVVRLTDGKNVIEGHSRPCDNLDDAIDVAGEMIED